VVGSREADCQKLIETVKNYRGCGKQTTVAIVNVDRYFQHGKPCVGPIEGDRGELEFLSL